MKEPLDVFVSYRRDDTRHVAGRLSDRLSERFRIFMDVDTIQPGTDFGEVIREAVGRCDVLLAIIGNHWIASQDVEKHRRLERSGDWVVEEIQAALQRHIRVIPVLVDGARMPEPDELPTTIASLATRQALTLHHETFASDVLRLMAVIDLDAGSQTQHEVPPAQPKRSWLRPAVIVGLALVLIVAGATVGLILNLLRGEQNNAANPPQSSTVVNGGTTQSANNQQSTPFISPTPSPKASSSEASAKQAPRIIGGTIKFRHFTVTASTIDRDSSRGIYLTAKVCVNSLPPNPQGDRTRVSWDPWRLRTSNATYRAQVSSNNSSTKGMFPRDATYRVGQCASGWIPFGRLSSTKSIHRIDYRNGIGDVATWRVIN